MKVKRYVGETAKEAMQKVKSDLGRDAIILNTRKIRKKGLAGLFSKPLIEVVATIDNDISSGARANNARNEHTIETNEFIKELNENLQGQKNSLKDNTKKHSNADEKELIQQDFMEIKNMLNKVYDAVKVDYENTKLSDVVKKYLKTLEDNEVDKVIVNEIKEKLMETLDSEKQQSDAIVRNTVYNILMKYVKEPEPF